MGTTEDPSCLPGLRLLTSRFSASRIPVPFPDPLRYITATLVGHVHVISLLIDTYTKAHIPLEACEPSRSTTYPPTPTTSTTYLGIPTTDKTTYTETLLSTVILTSFLPLSRTSDTACCSPHHTLALKTTHHPLETLAGLLQPRVSVANTCSPTRVVPPQTTNQPILTLSSRTSTPRHILQPTCRSGLIILKTASRRK